MVYYGDNFNSSYDSRGLCASCRIRHGAQRYTGQVLCDGCVTEEACVVPDLPPGVELVELDGLRQSDAAVRRAARLRRVVAR